MDEQKPEVPSKKVWESKTFYVSVLLALAPLIPGAQDFMKENPAVVSEAVVVIFMILRVVSHGKISLKP